MKDNEAGESHMAPGLVQLDEKTLVSVRLARSSQAPNQFRAVALAALQANQRVPLSSARTAGYGPDPQAALEACLGRVRESLTVRRIRPRRLVRRPDATL